MKLLRKICTYPQKEKQQFNVLFNDKWNLIIKYRSSPMIRVLLIYYAN